MTNKDLWICVLKRLQPTIMKAHFITWFENTIVLGNENGVVTVGVPSEYAFNWISDKYAIKILQALQEQDSLITEIKFEVHARFAQEGNTEAVKIKNVFSDDLDKKVRKARMQNEVRVSKGKDGVVFSKMLNQRYRLNNFIVGKENRLPHAACLAVSNSPGGIYNPLYVYGSVGLGKTHLLQAVGNEVLRNFPERIVKYMTAEKFVTEVVEAIGKRNMNSFKDQYRKVDCFLMDDIQFFSRKDSSQQEFFHTFNELYNNNKQIIITSDRSPSDLEYLDERLKSRFGMGMVVELLFPEFETRLAILQEKCKEFQVIIDPEVLEFIANNVHHSVRELEGVLRQVVAESELSQRVCTIRSVAEIIKRLDKAREIIGYDIGKKDGAFVAKSALDVMNIVAEYYRVSVNDLVSQNRHREFMVPRQVCMYLIKNELGESYEKIGLGFGGRNHTTVMHACNKTAKCLHKNIKLVRDINAIKREMGL